MAGTITTTQAVYSDFDIELGMQTDGDIQRDVELESIKNSIQNILTTKKGSRRMLPEFGSELDNMLFEPMDNETATKLGRELVNAIEMWDNRVVIENANINQNFEAMQYEVTITYSVQGSLQSQSEVFKIILKKI
jgi:uncharacterized protein